MFWFLVSFFALVSAAAAETSDIKLDVKEHVLSNGMTLVLVERHTAPVFYSMMYFKVGSANEVGGNIGSAHLLEHMMFKGTRKIGTSNWDKESALMDIEDRLYDKLYRLKGDMEDERVRRSIAGSNVSDDSSQMKVVLDSIVQIETALNDVIVPNQLEELYTENGGYDFNAHTGYDITSYQVAFPKNRLELIMMVEAERLRHPVFREFYSERDVVAEERRLSVDTQAPAKLFEQLIATTFVAHPYQIFWEWGSEVADLTRGEISDFFKTYYAPNRTVLAIVGDIDANETIKMAEKYFGDIPAQAPPKRIESVEPVQNGEKRVEVVFDAEPAIEIAYHKTAFDDPEDAVFNVITAILSRGRTSRFYKGLVEGKRLALAVDVSQFPWGDVGTLYPNVLVIDAQPKAPATVEQLEAAVYEELEKLKTTPVDSLELEKIKNNLVSDFIWGLYDGLGLADRLAQSQTIAGDWKYLGFLRERMSSVTAADIMRVARQYFTKENRTVAVLVPAKKES
jgi:predicted Zn-dependent peptidase